MSQILALDLAIQTGWALGTVHDTVPESGSFKITNDDASMAKLFNEWRMALRDTLSAHPDIKIVIFEAPLLPFAKQGKTSISAIRRLIGLAAITEELLYSYGGRYDVREARVSDVRCHFIGSNKHKRDQAKVLTKARCRQLGWNPVDDNAADALALWHYQVSLLQPKRALETSPLFQRIRGA